MIYTKKIYIACKKNYDFYFLFCLTDDFSRRYTVTNILGRGAFGCVYEGVRNLDRKTVNISTFPAKHYTSHVEHYIVMLQLIQSSFLYHKFAFRCLPASMEAKVGASNEANNLFLLCRWPLNTSHRKERNISPL